MPTKLLSVTDLRVSYGEGNVLKGIDLDLEAGEIMVIVGESGSGKTTLIRSIIKLLGKNADIKEGTINYKGRNLLNLSEKDLVEVRGRGIGMVFQNPNSHLTQLLKIKKQFLEVLKKHENFSKEEGIEIAKKHLEELNIVNPMRVLNSYPFQLSGGMLQRVYMAMVISAGPSLILADEPTSALDVKSQKKLADEFLKLKKKGTMGTIIVTHDLNLAIYLADKIIVMKDGKIVEKTTPKELLYGKREEYTDNLLRSVPRLTREVI